MVDATKAARTLQSSASNSAGGTTTGTGVNLTSALGMTVTAKITNGGTGPTVGCSFFIDVSVDGTNWKVFGEQQAGVTNDAVYEFVVQIPAAVMHVRSRFAGNTGQAVTVEAFGHEFSAIE